MKGTVKGDVKEGIKRSMIMRIWGAVTGNCYWLLNRGRNGVTCLIT